MLDLVIVSEKLTISAMLEPLGRTGEERSLPRFVRRLLRATTGSKMLVELRAELALVKMTDQHQRCCDCSV